jgi:predicted unusual protein kinase regulating ubiquinone biosynthesis (AarF/ABC1/UbiB family)
VFDYVDPKPISSASMAQVHRAVLKTGQKVAVKIQHSWIKEDAYIDLQMLELFVKAAYKINPDVDYLWLAKNLRLVIPGEIDFCNETNNSKKCAQLFKSNPHVKIPYVYEEFSNDRVITMEFIDGVNIDDV